MADFTTRRAGQQERLNLFEQAGDVSRLNAMAPTVQSPMSPNEGRLSKLRNIAQKNQLFSKVSDITRQQNEADARRRSEIRDMARLALSEKGVNLQERQFGESARRFDMTRGDALSNARMGRFDTLVRSGFDPNDVDALLNRQYGQGQAQPRQDVLRQQQAPQQAGNADLIQLRRMQQPGKPADLTKQVDAIATRFINSGIPESELYDEEGKPTRKLRAATQMMMAGAMPEQARQSAGLLDERTMLENEAKQIDQEIAKVSGFGKEKGWIVDSDRVNEMEARREDILNQLKGMPEQAPIATTGQMLERPQPQAMQQPQLAQPQAAITPQKRTKGDLSQFEGMEVRVGDKNNVPGVWAKDPNTGKSQFIGERELKGYFGDDFELGAPSASREGSTLKFKPSMMTLPGELRRPQAGRTDIAAPKMDKLAGQMPSRGEPKTEGDKLSDALEQQGVTPKEVLQKFDKGTREEKQASKPLITAYLDNPKRYKNELVKQYMQSVDVWAPQTRIDVSARRKFTTEGKDRRDQRANKWVTDTIRSVYPNQKKAAEDDLGILRFVGDIMKSGFPQEKSTKDAESQIGYEKAFKVFKRMEENKGRTNVTKEDFDMILRPELFGEAIKYFTEGVGSENLKPQAGEEIAKLLRSKQK